MQMKLQMDKKVKKFDRKKLKKLLETENEYIVDLLTICDVPDSIEDVDYDSMFLLNSHKNHKTSTATSSTTSNNKDVAAAGDDNGGLPSISGQNKRAENADDLLERLNIIKNKMKTKKNKITEKSAKRREMKKFKKNKEVKKILVSAHKSMKNEKHKNSNHPNHIKNENKDEIDTKSNIDQKPDMKSLLARPIFNEEGKIVFSKFDFASHPGAKTKKTRKEKVIKNPQEILRKMQETKQKIQDLNEQGDTEQARQLQKELAWQKVFDKVDGKSVRDDPAQLMKSIKKKEDIKRKSKKKWQERKEKVESDIAGRQKKRQENIDKRIQDKKSKKFKKLTKRGRMIPGFS